MEKMTLLLVANITKVVAYTERITEYKFYPAEPPKQKYICKWLGSIFPFSPISYGKTEELPDRWVRNRSGATSEYYDTDKVLKTLTWYKVNDEEKTVTQKASAYVYDSRNKDTNFLFESDDELYDFIDEIKSLSKNTFITITTNY